MEELKLNCPYFSENLKTLFTEYLTTCSHLRTAGEILSCVRSICNFAEKDFLALTRKDVDSYFVNMMERRLSMSTIRIRQNRYSMLVRFLNEKQPSLMLPNYFEMINFTAPEQYELSKEIVKNYVCEAEFKRLIGVARVLDDKAELIFSLSYVAALSASEICEMRHDHVARGENDTVQIYVYDESFHSERTITLDGKLGTLLMNYAACHSRLGSPYIFLNKHGHPLTLRNISALFRKCCHACGISDSTSFKDLRSTAVIRMLSEKDSSAVAEDANLRTARMNLYILARKNISEVPSREDIL